MSATTTSTPGPRGPGLRRLIGQWIGEHPTGQVLLFGGVLLLCGWVGSNTVQNMHRFGLTPGFAFLNQPANFEIGQALIPFSSGASYARAILVGLLNTIEVATIGCLLATLLGLLLGIARLSGNPLLGGMVQAYVELIRNTPLLLQLFFWSATVHALPPPRRALEPFAGWFLSNRGVFLPVPVLDNPPDWLGPALLAGLSLAIAAILLRRCLPRPIGALVAIGALGSPLLAAIAGGMWLHFDVPALEGFNFNGGVTLAPEFAALLVGLVINSAAGISEIVRASIVAVSRGQWDAGRALGFSFWRTLRLVVLPQALRTALPLLTSTYLSLTKSSSLAVAIGFPDLTSVIGTSANQTGQVLETMLILAGVYLTLSLATSVVMNLVNTRLALRG
ncbi:putative ABC transporter membrane subunit YhdX [Rhodovastum atsumiense]|uniref:amino acid ABC transporter permease n=1 Tax=Rhodovastum atsumiense TaxID=504468 RepID=UPI001EF14AEE|nr:ABC transporter permease subunit [Rhodovastum atsumiense]CAH2598812.1 putative ABC transporter membrane subunit YhdX [Rhodovastum atsumiense]